MFYDRKIKYLDVYERGERVQNAGFVRLEAREDKVSIQIRVEKLRHTDAGAVQVMLTGGGKEAVLQEIWLQKGCGALECRELDGENLAEGIGYEKLEKIYLKLPGERELQCVIQERKVHSTLENLPVLEAATISEDELMQEPVQVTGPGQMWEPQSMARSEQKNSSNIAIMERAEPETMQIPQPMEKAEPETMPIPQPMKRVESETMPMPQSIEGAKPENIQMPQPIERAKPETMPMPQPMEGMEPETAPLPSKKPQVVQNRSATKWQQLTNLYPHIRPFGDERDYLQVKPEDFVILTQKYYPLVSNSFLLHGFYNYEHLILCREKRKDGEHFYLGVPGNFYEKEKQVAVLFGFESFEGKTEPARSGDFGYYMITVEI